MSTKNNKVYLLTIILFIWTIIFNYLENVTNHHNIINYIFWIIEQHITFADNKINSGIFPFADYGFICFGTFIC